MATPATRFQSADAASAWPPGLQPDPYRLPPLPYEDVYLYRKRIDNRRVVRAADPAARRSNLRAIFAAGFTLVALILLLLPDVLCRVAGQDLVRLEKQQQWLARQKADLELEEAALLSPARLEEWARSLRMVDPEPSQLVSLGSQPDHTLAARARLR